MFSLSRCLCGHAADHHEQALTVLIFFKTSDCVSDAFVLNDHLCCDVGAVANEELCLCLRGLTGSASDVLDGQLIFGGPDRCDLSWSVLNHLANVIRGRGAAQERDTLL